MVQLYVGIHSSKEVNTRLKTRRRLQDPGRESQIWPSRKIKRQISKEEPIEKMQE